MLSKCLFLKMVRSPEHDDSEETSANPFPGPLMVNEVAPRPHNSGHYTIEAVPQMSQYQAQLHSVLDLDMPEKLVPKVRSALMLNILGGATPSSHHKVVRLARSTFGPDTACYLHLYGKESKPGRKIGHITMTGDGSIDELQQKSQPFIQMIDDIRQERLDFANGVTPKDPKPEPEQVKPTEQTKPSRKGSKKGKKSAAEVAKPNPINATQKEAQVNGDAPSRQPLVLVTMGSDSDLPVLKAGLEILRKFDVPYALDITSAHRTPKYMMRVADEAAGKGIKVIIAAAGGAAHLPGMLSSETPLPVIGVPVKATHMDGLDSLLSIVQMPVCTLQSFTPSPFLVLTASAERCSHGNGRDQQLHQRSAARCPYARRVYARVPRKDESVSARHGRGCDRERYQVA